MFAAVLIPNFALQAVLRHEPELRLQAVVLVDPLLPKPNIVQLTAAARSQGIYEGLTASQAMARCEKLIVKSRSPAQEQAAADILLQTAYAFSPNLEATAPGVCLLELKGLGIRWNDSSVEAWAGGVLEAFAQLDLEAQIGFALTPELALVAGRAANPVLVLEGGTLTPALSHPMSEGETMQPADKSQPSLFNQQPAGNSSVRRERAGVKVGARAAIESLTIAALEPPPEILEVLHRWGIHRIGALLALGKDRIAERLGPAAVQLFDRVSTTAVRPLKLAAPPNEFAERMEFEVEIETIEPLLFVLRRFIEQLARRLELVYLVIGEFHLRLGLASGAAYERTFKIPAPTGNIETLFRMLQTHLETVRTDSPIASLRLAAQPSQPDAHQFGLFETTLRDPNQFAETLGRLIALCGPDRVGTPQLESTHRPDAFRIVGQTFLSAGSPDFPVRCSAGRLESRPNRQTRMSALQSGLALRRFRPALPASIEFREQRPALFRSQVFNGAIVDTRGPFVSSGNWWEESRWTREEWDVQTSDGALYRIFRLHNGCFVEGVYD